MRKVRIAGRGNGGYFDPSYPLQSKGRQVSELNQSLIRVHPAGRLANQMAQFMLAREIQMSCGTDVIVRGYHMPEWGLDAGPDGAGPRSNLSIGSSLTRVNYLSAMIDRYRPVTLELDGVVQRVGNYGNIDQYRNIFPLRQGEGVPIGDDCILTHIRAGDVSAPSHNSYGPIPISYYQYLISVTKLRPVFIGEISPSPYIEALASKFPKAEFVGGASAFDDFQTMRRARHLAISVSSFSWLAALLSNAETIHVPLAGLLDPRARPDVDLLPLGDPRYRFHNVSAGAWHNRYSDIFAHRCDFGPISAIEAGRLKAAAARWTAWKSAKVHFGLMRRMIVHKYCG